MQKRASDTDRQKDFYRSRVNDAERQIDAAQETLRSMQTRAVALVGALGVVGAIRWKTEVSSVAWAGLAVWALCAGLALFAATRILWPIKWSRFPVAAFEQEFQRADPLEQLRNEWSTKLGVAEANAAKVRALSKWLATGIFAFSLAIAAQVALEIAGRPS